MIGIDITKISRFENASESLIKKILHLKEIDEYNRDIDKAHYLAKRWAIKEALFKANNDFFPFSSILLTGKDRVLEFPGYAISTSKEDDYYVAIVIKKGEN